MFVKRFGVVCACVLGLVLSAGVVQARAAAPTRVLKFVDGPTNFAGIGFDASSTAVWPVGARVAITLRIKNAVPQFGKPSGAVVGRVLIECTVLGRTSHSLDGNCFGIAHVPDGFLTFEGNGALSSAKVNYYAITGGVGPYANARGEIKAVGSRALVTLYSP